VLLSMFFCHFEYSEDTCIPSIPQVAKLPQGTTTSYRFAQTCGIEGTVR
jgi:hypothetical protein